MRLAAVIIALVVFVSWWSQCSSNSKSDSKAISSNNSANQKPSPDVGEKREKELRSQYEAMKNDIRRASRKLGIENLSDSSSGTTDEIRVWLGFGLIYPRCFILTNVQGARQARYLAPKVVGGRTKSDKKGDVVFAKNVVGTPKSGWDKLDGFLREQGIDSSIKLAAESQHTIDPDEQVIAIEVRSGSTYSMVFFHSGNEGMDAQKALNVCRRLESEFNVKMDCWDAVSIQ